MAAAVAYFRQAFPDPRAEIPEPLSAIIFRGGWSVQSGHLRRAIAKMQLRGAQPLVLVASGFTIEACRLAEGLGARVMAREFCHYSDDFIQRVRIWTGAHVKKPTL